MDKTVRDYGVMLCVVSVCIGMIIGTLIGMFLQAKGHETTLRQDNYRCWIADKLQLLDEAEATYNREWGQ